MASGSDGDSGSEEVFWTGMPTSGSSASPGETAAPRTRTTRTVDIAALKLPLPTREEAKAIRAKQRAKRKKQREDFEEAWGICGGLEQMKRFASLNLEVSSPATAARLISARRQRDVERTGRKGEDPATSASRQHEALGQSQIHEAASMFPAAVSHTGSSQAGRVTQAQASFFLERQDNARYWKPCRTDITNGRFDWRSFVTGRSWYRTHIKIFKGEGFGITRFEVAWHNRLSHSVFLGTRADGQKFMVNPRAPPGQPEWSWSTGDIDAM